jgi:hypothetical protein
MIKNRGDVIATRNRENGEGGCTAYLNEQPSLKVTLISKLVGAPLPIRFLHDPFFPLSWIDLLSMIF